MASSTYFAVRATSQRSSGREPSPSGGRGEVGVAWAEAFDVPVVDEEAHRVPEREELPLDLLRRPVAEEQVPIRRLSAELPAHDVGANARKRIRRIDRVPPRAVHLLAALVEHLLVAEHGAKRRSADERDRHEELRVEPEANLLAHLRDPVGGEPRLPVGVVGEVGAGKPDRGAGRVSVLDPRRGSPSRAWIAGRCPRRARRPRPPGCGGRPRSRRTRSGS